MYYPDELVEEVRTRNDIVDVISGYVKLQKKGGNYFGLCPFHNEKSPSFSVSPGKQMYYCFGCGAGGNVITFVMEYENYSFPEALSYLAERVGMELPKEEVSKEAREQADLKSRLLEVNKIAARYFHHQLKSERGSGAYQYLTGRQLTDATIVRFGLGYSNKYSDDLYQYLKKMGYSDSLLRDSGLVTIEEKGSFDKFWNRVMFPIMDVNNRVIGFGGRVMGDAKPKYLNSPETKLFDKSRNLYGLNFARTSREKYMLICEGYMDVIALHQAGFTNAVASLGTALTTQHANLLKRYTEQVVLTYDSDEAGTKAALRAIPILKEVGMSIKVLNMQPYKDPDEFIKAEGADGFRRRIEEAAGSFMFEVGVMRREYDMEDPEQKTGFYHAVAKKLLDFPEALERNNYIEAVSKAYYINYDDLKKLVNDYGSRYAGAPAPSQKPERQPKKDKDDGLKKSQRLLLTWLIERPELFSKVSGVIAPRDFVEPLYHQVAEMVFEQQRSGQVNPAAVLNYFINDEEQYKDVAALFHATLNESLNNDEQKKALQETILRVKKNSIDHAMRSALDLMKLQELLDEQAKLQKLHISLD